MCKTQPDWRVRGISGLESRSVYNTVVTCIPASWIPVRFLSVICHWLILLFFETRKWTDSQLGRKVTLVPLHSVWCVTGGGSCGEGVTKHQGFDTQTFLLSRFWFCCCYCCPYFCFAINGGGGHWIGLGQLTRAVVLPSDCIFPVNMLIILGNYESVKM